MSQAIFPKLPGLTWGITRTPVWSTQVQTSSSGREMRAAYWSYPIWRYSLKYELLRADARQELQQLVGFFNARKGSFENFLFDDPDDNKAVEQAFGVTVAGHLHYQLARSYGGVIEPVLAPKPGAVLKANGTVLNPGEHYTLGDDGRVTLNVAPAPGYVLTWTGGFWWRCRFTDDSTSFEQFMHRLWSAQRIEFQTVKL